MPLLMEANVGVIVKSNRLDSFTLANRAPDTPGWKSPTNSGKSFSLSSTAPARM